MEYNVTRRSFFSALYQYITQPAWLPRVIDLVGAWGNMHVETVEIETVATKISLEDKDCYNFIQSINEICFKKHSAGGYYVSGQSHGTIGYLVSLITHLFGALSMMVLDILALTTNLMRLPYNVLTGDFKAAYINLEQAIIRLISCAAKPLQWGGLFLSVLVGIWHADTRDQVYVSIERDMYFDVFHFGPIVPLIRRDDGGYEPLLSEVAVKADEINAFARRACFSHRIYSGVSQENINALNNSVTARCNLSGEGQQTVLEDKLRQMEKGETLENTTVRLVTPGVTSS